MISILEALDDPELFQPAFRGSSWKTWRVFLQGLFGLKMTRTEFATYQAHTGREAAPKVPFREAALVIGRRGGKSRILALVAVYLATFRDYSSNLAAGEQGVVAIIAADRRQARILIRYIVGLLQSVSLLEGEIEQVLAEAIVLKNGVVIEIHTGTIASPRGRTYIAVLADEIAFWSSEDSANPDVEVIAAVRPGLVSIPGSMLLMASSPYSKRGVLWRTYREHFGKESRVLVWRGTTEEMNPLIDPELIKEAYEADPASASSEYGAEFRSDVSGYIDREVVEALLVPGRGELPRLVGQHYHAFVDVSGGSHDSMVLAIGHAEAQVGVLDLIDERRPPFSPEAVTAEFAQRLRGYGVTEVFGDRYAALWPVERFREHGITYTVSERSKSQIYQELLPLINSKKLELLDSGRLITQLCSLERRTGRGTGRDIIDHPPGAHDDVANATAGVLVAVAGQPDVIELWTRFGAGITHLNQHFAMQWRREGRI